MIECFPVLLNEYKKICIFSFYRDNFEDESPFHPDTSNSDDSSTANENGSKIEKMNCEKFQELTADPFARLIKEMRVIQQYNDH